MDNPFALIELLKRERAGKERGGLSQWIPHAPFPNQQRFLALDCLEALYGGAAGGGKSDALLMAALQYVDTPGYSAILFRRTYSDLALPDAIMARSHEWLAGTKAHWNGDLKLWTFPSGATLGFGYLDNDRDRYRYQGSAYAFCGFDETTQFPESWCRYLFSRLRRLKGSTVPIRWRGATNPGGIGHKWVKSRFIDRPEDRVFVPSKLADNPHIDQAEYIQSLAQLDPTTRRQLERGEWVEDTSGLVYSHFDRARNVRPAPEREGKWRYLLGLDFGFTDDCAFCVVGWQQYARAVWCLESHKLPELTPSQAAEQVQALQARYSFDRIVGDLGGLGKGYGEEMRRRWAIPILPAEKNDKAGYIRLLNGALANGELLLAVGTNDALVTELEELAWSDDTHAKEAPGLANHLCDALLYSWRGARAYQEPDEPSAEMRPGTPEWAAAEGPRLKAAAIAEAVKRQQASNRALWRAVRR